MIKIYSMRLICLVFLFFTTYSIVRADNKITRQVIKPPCSLPDLKIYRTDSSCARFYFSTDAGASTGLDYEWEINGVLVSNSESFAYSFLRNGRYVIRLTETDAGICSKTFTDTVVLNSLPDIRASKDTTICMYDSVRLSATGAVKYLWKSADGKFSSAGQSVRVPPGTYYVTGTDSAGCSAMDTVVVNAVGNELQWDKDIYACEGDSINIVVKNGEGYYFTWWASGAQFPLPDTTNWVHTRWIRSPYNFYAFKPFTHCWVHGTINVHANHLTAGGAVSACRGDSVRLHASGGTQYKWTAAPGLNDLNIPNPYVHTTTDRTYAVQITDSIGCTKQDTVQVKVSDVSLVVSKAVTICPGSKVRLSASGATHYLWSPASGLNDREIATPTASPSVTTMYHVIACDSLCGCVKHDSVLVTVLPAVKADAGPDQRICHGDTVILGTPAKKGYHYEWSSSDPNFRIETAQLKVAPEVNTTYTMHITDSATGCSDTDLVNVTIIPTTPLKLIEGILNICPFTATIYRVNSDPGYTYHWRVSGGKLFSVPDSNRIMVEWLDTQSTIVITRTSREGCKDSLVFPIVFFKKPHAGFIALKTCAGLEYNFLDTSKGNVGHQWNFGDSWTDFSQTGSISHVYKKPGLYRVKETVNNDNGMCFDTISKVIQVLPRANAHWQAAVSDSGKVYFSAFDSSGLAYQWDFGDSSTFLGPKTLHSYRNPGNYVISLTITDTSDCTARQDSVIFIKPWTKPLIISEDSLTISPNPFSENIHVRYYLKEKSSDVKVFIYDMLGKEIYASASTALPAGSYDQEISTAGHQSGPGMYVIRVVINDKATIRKMLKVKYY